MATTSDGVVVRSEEQKFALIGNFYRALDTTNVSAINNLSRSDPWLVNLQKEYPQCESPLHRVARANNSVAMKLLIERGAQISKDSNGDTPLHVAVRNNAYQWFNRSDSCVSQLVALEIGQIHVANNQGDQPLHIACRKQYIVIAQCLVQLGAQKDARNERSETPRSIALYPNNWWTGGLVQALASERIPGI